tara:strand:- start:6672 stop:6827 length:156 start_codon:yes stop_codon:yes gene_type:complete
VWALPEVIGEQRQVFAVLQLVHNNPVHNNLIYNNLIYNNNITRYLITGDTP